MARPVGPIVAEEKPARVCALQRSEALRVLSFLSAQVTAVYLVDDPSDVGLLVTVPPEELRLQATARAELQATLFFLGELLVVLLG